MARHRLPRISWPGWRRRCPRAEIIALTNFWNTGHLALKLRELGERGLFARGGPSRLKLGSSLDGLEKTHDLVRGQAGAFAGLVRSVKTLKAEFPEISFGFTFTMIPRNAGELYDVYRFVTRELGVGFGAQWAVETAGIEPIVWSPEARESGLRGIRRIAEDICAGHSAAARMRGPERRESAGLWSELLYWRYLEEYGRDARRFPFFLRCTAGERHVMVGAEGEVFYCPVNRTRTIGNVRETPLDEMWKSPKAAEERAFVASGKCHCWLRCVSSPAVNRASSTSGCLGQRMSPPESRLTVGRRGCSVGLTPSRIKGLRADYPSATSPPCPVFSRRGSSNK